MGCALPLATGYKIAHPERPVVAFTGDAGLEMVLGELATLRDTGLPVIVIVFIDESLALIEMKQRSSGYPNTGVDFGATDFVGVGAAMSMHSTWVEDRNGLEIELRAALARQQSSLIACRVGSRPYDGKI
jgi:acetolactate synthase-1/2/3 large subunit